MVKNLHKNHGKVSSRTDSKFSGPLYNTYYCKKHNDGDSESMSKEAKISTRRKNSIKSNHKKISMNAISMSKNHHINKNYLVIE